MSFYEYFFYSDKIIQPSYFMTVSSLFPSSCVVNVNYSNIINHEILLTNREQYVSINNVDPNPRVIQCGVLQ